MKRTLAFALILISAACGSSSSALDARRTTSPTRRGELLGSTNVIVTGSPSPSGYGQPVTFTATVTAADGSNNSPTGTISFSDATAGALGSAQLQPGPANVDQGDTNAQGSAGGPGQGYNVGQDWQAGYTGKLQGIQLALRNCGNAGGNATLNLYTGHVFDDTRSAQPIATSTIALPGFDSCFGMDGNAQGNGYFAFDVPVDVVGSDKLNFEVSYGGGSYLNTFIDYYGSNPGGQGYVNYGSSLSPVGVLVFRTLMAGGQIASVTVSTLEAGTHTVTASYAGDGNFAANAGSMHHEVDPARDQHLSVGRLEPRGRRPARHAERQRQRRLFFADPLRPGDAVRRHQEPRLALLGRNRRGQLRHSWLRGRHPSADGVVHLHQ